MEEKFSSQVSPTLLIPLYYRATESKRGEDAILHDPKAVELIGKIDYDFSVYPMDIKPSLGCPVRSWYFDQNIIEFIKSHQNEETCIVVNLGCGLDTRMDRIEYLANKNNDFSLQNVKFVEIDLPDVIEYRETLIPPKENQIHISMSIFEVKWMRDLLEKYGKVNYIFVAEGVFPYFENETLKKFFDDFANEFAPDKVKNVELWFDTTGSSLIKKKESQPKPLKVHKGAPLKMQVDDPNEFEKWNPKYKLIKANTYQDFFKWRWGILFGYCLPLFPSMMKKFSFLCGLKLN
ncbi:O-methyltransferase N-terminus family protein [Trichomonas vaginalis G3]|uniref:O-methyltransferase N-terminus family protein n=1 Tax=Trichomonas vaginalis (strain ATCC PRA-98 / G3) TaxID=412133 RepID=A2F5C5_TRIV3|nr:S-adenosyl-l-methionine-dependent methyltransferase yktd-related family [Trichomonas vaginalis G3]EAX99888.1 O-methyltransferase N-terminus family protein [Trichomonas vaginalis G3]KAI5492932.1 S-adenosyl-l-methionine-dependent methyltransferase yktd-related family [Trichomonas vaginalis G3]|eukprot:XP_001312818.1 O-methyltransferase N-terminus family protein [Trichomonas vaginalis G3]